MKSETLIMKSETLIMKIWNFNNEIWNFNNEIWNFNNGWKTAKFETSAMKSKGILRFAFDG